MEKDFVARPLALYHHKQLIKAQLGTHDIRGEYSFMLKRNTKSQVGSSSGAPSYLVMLFNIWHMQQFYSAKTSEIHLQLQTKLEYKNDNWLTHSFTHAEHSAGLRETQHSARQTSESDSGLSMNANYPCSSWRAIAGCHFFNAYRPTTPPSLSWCLMYLIPVLVSAAP